MMSVCVIIFGMLLFMYSVFVSLIYLVDGIGVLLFFMIRLMVCVVVVLVVIVLLIVWMIFIGVLVEFGRWVLRLVVLGMFCSCCSYDVNCVVIVEVLM